MKRTASAVGAALLLLSASAAAHDIVPPKPILQPSAEWPAEPSPHDVVIPVILVIGKDGAVEHVEVEVSVDRELDAAAIRAARRWVFEPARDDSGPVRARVRAAVRFDGQKKHTHTHAHAKPPAPADAHSHAHPHPHAHAHPPAKPHAHAHAHARARAKKPAPIRVLGHGETEHGVTEVTVRGRRPARTASQLVRERDVLEAAPHRTASDMLRTVPGVFVTQHSGEGKAHQIFFRGFDAVHGQDIEIDVAGAPINEVSNVHGQGYADLHFLPPEVVQRIDALPGAFDPSQGDFAVAGSMRFHLGVAEPGIHASGSYGTFNTRRMFLAYRPEGQPEETFGAFESYASDGFGIGRASQRTSGLGQVVFDLDNHLRLRLMGSVYAGRFGSAGVLPLEDIDSGRIDRFGSYDLEQGGRSVRVQLVTELGYADDKWEATLAPFVIRRELRLRHNFTGFVADPERGDNTTQENDATTVGLNGRVTRSLPIVSDADSVGAGIYARYDDIDQSHAPSHGEGPALVDADVSAVDVGGWLDMSIRPVSRLMLRGAVRVDGLTYAVDDQLGGNERTAQGVNIAPKASADVVVVPGLHVSGAYGLGFRSPQARSLADGEETPFTRVHTFELGARYRPGRQLNASVAGFAALLDDDLVFNEATSRNETVPGTLRMGVAADLEVRSSDWFTSAFGLVYSRATFRETDARFVEGELLPYVPQLIARADLSARPVLAHFWKRDLTMRLGAGFDFLFNRPLPFGERGSDVFLVDALAGLRLGEVELGVEATNLFGAQWYDGEFVYASRFDPTGPGSSLPRRHVSVGAPRTVMGTLTLHL